MIRMHCMKKLFFNKKENWFKKRLYCSIELAEHQLLWVAFPEAQHWLPLGTASLQSLSGERVEVGEGSVSRQEQECLCHFLPPQSQPADPHLPCCPDKDRTLPD